MITEDYVSFETAKLLKEKGFDGNCDMYYKKDGSIEYTQLRYNHNLQKNHYSRPTLQMAMKWLREVHNLFIWIGCDPKRGLKWYYQVFRTDVPDGYVVYIDDNIFGMYESTCDAAIKYALENLI